MIDDIVRQVETDFPKRVYLTDDVNASVFYDSSFWSMFLPIKKNLQIGVGLINSVTEAELKAILAHEFGHFSQRTMKVGSYVYNVNHIIYNLVNDNDGYNNIISNWASVSGYFSIFVSIAVWIVRGIQWILSKMYGVVNKSYMALSREMEFHADEIAATVTGSAPLKTSLLRLSLASESYDSVLNFYQGKVGRQREKPKRLPGPILRHEFLGAGERSPRSRGAVAGHTPRTRRTASTSPNSSSKTSGLRTPARRTG